MKKNTKELKKLSFLAAMLYFIIFSMFFMSSHSQAYTIDDNSGDVTFEENLDNLDLEQIMNVNIKSKRTKEKLLLDQEIPYPTTFKENPALPKDEQHVLQEGVNGKQKVNLVRSYENGNLIEETIINTIITKIPVEQIVEVGTSDFLNKHQVHIGDVIYVLNDTYLKEHPNADSRDICKLKKYADLTILSVAGQWCKISYGTLEGYVNADDLTSTHSTPGIDVRSRMDKIVTGLNFNMALNKPSGLTLEDFKKVLSGNPQDKNKVIEENAQAFYEAEQRYQVNGIFIASVAIHESNWATSNISNDKKNLFGYGAYDSDAYNYAFTFGDYREGIDLIAKVFAKNYINPPGTKIYDDEIAQAKYYNGSTLSAVNMRYCTDVNWAQKVYSYMEYLYGRL